MGVGNYDRAEGPVWIGGRWVLRGGERRRGHSESVLFVSTRHFVQYMSMPWSTLQKWNRACSSNCSIVESFPCKWYTRLEQMYQQSHCSISVILLKYYSKELSVALLHATALMTTSWQTVPFIDSVCDLAGARSIFCHQ